MIRSLSVLQYDDMLNTARLGREPFGPLRDLNGESIYTENWGACGLICFLSTEQLLNS